MDVALPKVCIVTPAIGHRHLGRCLASVQAQSTPAQIEHLLVIDGPDLAADVEAIAAAVPAERVPRRTLALPYPTGRDGYLGHRIYGAVPFLVNAPYVSFLDEDNWLDPDHVESLLAAVEAARAPWGFALCKIVDDQGTFLCNDECECLGNLHFAMNVNGVIGVDANCYLLRRESAVEHAAIWHRRFREPGKPNPDLELANRLLRCGAIPTSSRKHSVNYAVGATEQSVKADYFQKGNAAMRQRYPDGMPWTKPGFVPIGTAPPRPPGVAFQVIR